MGTESHPPRPIPDPLPRPKSVVAPEFVGSGKPKPSLPPPPPKHPMDKLAEAVAAVMTSSAPSRSRILPRQDDELPSIWDLYMIGALAGMAMHYDETDVDDSREEAGEISSRAAELVDASIQERKKREGGT